MRTTIRIIENETGDMYAVGFTCPFCGRMTEILMSEYEAHLYYDPDMNVKDIFPNLAPEQREIMISGMCIKCQRKNFNF